MKRFSVVVVFFGFITALFFWKTIIFGLVPIPSDSIVGLYHPWRDVYEAEYPRGIPYKNFLITDPLRQQIPWRKQVIDAYRTGVFPGWDHTVFSGIPLDSNIQSGMMYPFNILFFFLRFEVAWTVLVMLQPFLGGIFMYLYIRAHLRDTVAAVAGGIAFMFSGFNIAWMTWGTISQTLLWVPFLLYLMDCAIDGIHSRSTFFAHIHIPILLWFAFYSMLTAGHAQIALYGSLLVFLYGIFRVRKKTKNRTWSVIGVGVSGLLVIPFLYPMYKRIIDFSLSSMRIENPAYELPEGWFMPVVHLVQFLIPDYFGSPATLNYWGTWNYGEMVGYIGICGMVFVLYSFRRGMSGVGRFWLFTFFVSLILALDTPIARGLRVMLPLPVLASFQPTRLLSVSEIALAFLIAYGFSVFRKRLDLGKGMLGRNILFLTFFGLLIVWTRFGCNLADTMPDCQNSVRIALRNSVLPGIFLSIAVFLTIIRFRFLRWSRLIDLTIIVVLTIDLFRFGWKYTPFTSLEYFYPASVVTSFLSNESRSGGRILSLDEKILPVNSGSYFGIQSVDGYDSLYSARYARLVRAVNANVWDPPPEQVFERILRIRSYESPLLPVFSVQYILSLLPVPALEGSLVLKEEQTHVYSYSGYIPKIRFATAVRTVQDENRALEALFDPEFEASNTAVIEKAGESISEYGYFAGDILKVKHMRNGEYVLETVTESKRLILISEPWNGNWHASVDGRPVAVYHTNYAFMGVEVPSGSHTVRLKYQSLWEQIW